MSRRFKQILAIIAATGLLVCFNNCGEGFKTLSEENQSSLQSLPGDETNPPPTLPPSDGTMVDVFLASGHMGRTVMSCDDGQTWINDRSDNEAARCWINGDPNYVECDHTPSSGVGLATGDGWFFAQFGWGHNGSVRRTRNGVNWETVRTNGWGGGVVYAQQTLLSLFGNGWGLSSDLGSTWKPVENIDRGDFIHPYAHAVGDQFFVMGRYSATNKMLAISSDKGATWSLPENFHADWGHSFVEGKGIIVSIGYTRVTGGSNIGHIARSTDKGLTWTRQEAFVAPSQIWDAGVLFDGTHFVTWSKGELWKSTDGLNWTQTKVTGSNPGRSIAAYNPKTETYVRINTGSQANYDRQDAWRSSDGIFWTRLSETAFKGGHPIKYIVHGQMDSNACAGAN